MAAADGHSVALLFGYACHATALGPDPRLNGDWPGFALERLEADHPGAVALFLAGCGGDGRHRGSDARRRRPGHGGEPGAAGVDAHQTRVVGDGGTHLSGFRSALTRARQPAMSPIWCG